jgi:hypothetical protein
MAGYCFGSFHFRVTVYVCCKRMRVQVQNGRFIKLNWGHVTKHLMALTLCQGGVNKEYN